MKQIKKLLITTIVISIFWILSSLNAIQKLEVGSLEDVVRYARVHNSQLAVLKKKVEFAKGEVIRSGTLSNPEISALKDKDETEVEIEQAYQFGWTLGQKVARFSYQMVQQDLTIFEQDLVKDIAVSSVRLQTFQKLLNFFKETIDLNNTYVTIGKARYKRGEISELDVWVLEQEADSAYQEMLITEKDYQTEIAAYKMLIGYLESDPLIIPSNGNLSLLFQTPLIKRDQSIAKHPQVQLLELERKKMENDLSFSYAKRLPPIKVGMRYKNENRENFYGVSLGIPIPIFDRNQADIYEDKRLLEKNGAQLKFLRVQLLQNIEVLQLEMETSKKQMTYYQARILPRAKKMMTLTESAYSQGRTNVFELLFIQKQQIEVKQKFIQTQGDYQETLVKLHHAWGKPIIGPSKMEVK